jgi:hypothetical protein
MEAVAVGLREVANELAVCDWSRRIQFCLRPSRKPFCSEALRCLPLSRRCSSSTRRKTVKKILLVLAAAVLFVNTLILPTLVHADGTGGTDCGGQGGLCKP